MAPRISRLFDHEIRIWRPVVIKDTMGVEKRTYEQRPGLLGAFLNRSVDPVAPVAAGLAPVGRLRLYCNPTVDIQVRDVVQLVSGSDATPQSQLTWEVDQPPVHPKGHHTQVDAVEWHGILPEAQS